MKLDFGFVPFPREIWEKPINLTKAEFRLLGWFLCQFKLGVQQATYSDKEILEGSDGLPGIRLGWNNFKAARSGLMEKALLESVQLEIEGQWRYRLLLSRSASKTDSKPVSLSETDRCSDSKTSKVLSATDNVLILRNSDTDTETEKTKSFLLPDWVPLEPWNGFVEMRKKGKSPFTERAKKLLITELEKLKSKGYDPGACLDMSTMQGWSSVYEPRNGGNGNGNGHKQSRKEQILAEFLADDGELEPGRGQAKAAHV